MADLISMLAACAGGGEKDPDFNQTVLLLHGDGTNGAQNNTFLDGSTNNFTITRNGNTTQGTFSPFSLAAGEWSNYFDGTGDYLSVADNAAFSFGTGAFTIEAWVYGTGPGAVRRIYHHQTTDTNQISILQLDTNKLNFFVRTSSTTICDIVSTNNLVANVWNHVVCVRDGSNFSAFINGQREGTASSATTAPDPSGLVFIGTINGSTEMWLGYISNLRVVKGTAVYDPTQTTLTVPTAPLTAITNTSLLTCQSNRFVDNSTNAFAITSNGDVRVTPFSPFAPTAAYSAGTNGGSGYFDGTGDYLSIADAAGLRFGTGNFTIQCWIYRNAVGAVHSIAAKGGASTGWVFQVHSDNKLRFTHTTTNIDSTGTIPASAWTHVAVVREGTGTNQVKLYINGVNDGQGTVSTDFTQTEQLNIGADRGNSNVMNGYIAGWKYVVGTAETITLPTAPPTGGTLLCNFTNAGIFDNTGKNNLETVGNAQIDTTTKKYGTGSMEFDGTGDWLFLPTSELIPFASSEKFTVEGWINPSVATGGQIYGIYSTRDNTSAYGLAIVLALNPLKLLAEIANNLTGVSVTSSTTIVASTWVHFAAVHDGTQLKLYINGVSEGTPVNTSQATTLKTAAIGRYYTTVDNYYFNGFIDDLRITKGVARYTANFTPPTAAFPNE